MDKDLTRLDRLMAAAKYHGTDKVGHGYIEFYAAFLPEHCRSMLEIGIAKGASALMWDEFYGKEELDLHYLDLFINPEFVSARWCRNRNFTPHAGDQSDISFLAGIRDQFDLIVDDGSHNAMDQTISFAHLFVNNLKSGGLYVVEDCHCCKDTFYWNSHLITDEVDTILGFFKMYLQYHETPSNPFIPSEQKELFDNLIAKVIITPSEKQIFIWKK